MNLDTLKDVLDSFERFRKDIISNDYDIRMIMTGILSFLIEELKYEVEKNKSKNSYS